MENFDDIDEPVVLSPFGRKKTANSARSISKQCHIAAPETLLQFRTYVMHVMT